MQFNYSFMYLVNDIFLFSKSLLNFMFCFKYDLIE